MRTNALLTSVVCATFACGLVACSEVDQTAKTEKVYAGKKDEHAYDNKLFGNDKQKWEATLAQRTRTQNEYLRKDTN